jgi:cytidyltransferase-like protein
LLLLLRKNKKPHTVTTKTMRISVHSTVSFLLFLLVCILNVNGFVTLQPPPPRAASSSVYHRRRITGGGTTTTAGGTVSTFTWTAVTSAIASSSSNDTAETATPSSSSPPPQKPQHTLAILALPATTWDRMVNDAILTAAVANPPRKLSVVLRCEGKQRPSTAALRRYVSEIYSQLWDTCVAADGSDDTNDEDDDDNNKDQLLQNLDVVVYPQNLPNAAPEAWIDIQPDLDCVCTADVLCGWWSEEASGRGRQYQNENGLGGVAAHVQALNRERASRGLNSVQALPVTLPVTDLDQVVFLEDDVNVQSNVDFQFHHQRRKQQQQKKEETNKLESSTSDMENGILSSDDDITDDDDADYDVADDSNLLAGARSEGTHLFDHVTVGGTFDGLHFGHRKLLTLAVSSVTPLSGRLMVGVTVDKMLTKKKYPTYIPNLEERIAGVRSFLQRLAPGMMKYVVFGCDCNLVCGCPFVRSN